MSVRLYIGNLPEDITRQDLETVFSEGGDESASAKLITDRKTGKCRGFGFVTVKTDEEADQFIEKFNGVTVKETVLKIEKALPRAKEAEGDAPATPVSNNIPAPISAANRTKTATGGGANKGGGGNRSGGGGNKGGGGNRSGGGGNKGGGGGASTDNGAFQPDPRWASVLEQLKEQLNAQAVE